jgi:hypothetical protein
MINSRPFRGYTNFLEPVAFNADGTVASIPDCCSCVLWERRICAVDTNVFAPMTFVQAHKEQQAFPIIYSMKLCVHSILGALNTSQSTPIFKGPTTVRSVFQWVRQSLPSNETCARVVLDGGLFF